MQKQLLKSHEKLNHLGFQQLKWIGRKGWLSPLGNKIGHSSIDPPKCAACQFGKQARTPREGITIKRDKEKEGILKKNKLNPGDLIFTDQYESSLGGRIFSQRGFNLSS